MTSWVRYSVAVYLGLLLAGSVVVSPPRSSVGSSPLRDMSFPVRRLIADDAARDPATAHEAADEAHPARDACGCEGVLGQ